MLDVSSPRTRARITGVVYLLFFLTAIVGALIPPNLTVPGGVPEDAALVASKVTGNMSGYEIEVAFGLISTAFYVALIALLYRLLRPAGKTAAILMLAFGLVGCTITAVESFLQLGPVAMLSGDAYLNVFSSSQRAAMALLFLRLSAESGAVALVFFGVFQLFLGYLIFTSGFLPRVIGAVVAIAGVGWLTYLYPPLAAAVATPVAIAGAAAELALMLWLLVFGVNPTRWTDRAASDR